MRKFLPLPFVVGALVLALSGGISMGAENQDGPIVIGVLENAGFAFAPMMKGSFNLALEKINSRGGINGRLIKLVFADDGGKKKMGIAAVKQLVKKEKSTMLVGGYSSSNTLYMARTAEKMGVPFLVCTAADDRITQRKKINIFRLNPPAAEYTKGLEALFVQKIHPDSMAIVYENSPYGTSGGLRMMYFCRENDIDITAILPYHREKTGVEDLDRLVKPLKNNPPDIIYMISYMKDGIELVKKIRAAKIDSLLCGGAGGFTHPDFIRMAGAASQYLITATLWTADQKDVLAKQYVALYRNRFKQMPDYHGAEAYSALMVAADALRRTKSLKAKELRDALMRTDLNTPFGHVKFGSYGRYERQNSKATLVLQVMGDQYRCVWPMAVSVANLVIPQK